VPGSIPPNPQRDILQRLVDGLVYQAGSAARARSARSPFPATARSRPAPHERSAVSSGFPTRRA